MQPLVLALDGGGSKTVLAAADRDGRVLALSTGRGCNAMDNPHWREGLTGLIEGAGIHWSKVQQAAVGMPGYGEAPHIDARVAAAIGDLVPPPHVILNDVQMAHDAAFMGQPGILVLAGTGSMVWATGTAEANLRVGGWGPDIGDEGSGYWIGRQALTQLSRALDGRNPAHLFTAALMRRMGLPSGEPIPALMGWLYGLPHMRSGVAALAEDVDALAQDGDETALQILERAADHLHAQIAAARHRIGGAGIIPWSPLGGVFQSQTLRALLARREGAGPVEARLPPIGGGLWRAANLAGWTIDRPWIDRLAASLAGGTPSPAAVAPVGRA